MILKCEKLLLLKDLSARLTYGVKINVGLKYPGKVETLYLINIKDAAPINYKYKVNEVRPYLRSMSSMTKEEREEAKKYTIAGGGWTEKGFSWLLSHHFDFNGLIEKGLAIEVTEKNNPY